MKEFGCPTLTTINFKVTSSCLTNFKEIELLLTHFLAINFQLIVTHLGVIKYLNSPKRQWRSRVTDLKLCFCLFTFI